MIHKTIVRRTRKRKAWNTEKFRWINTVMHKSRIILCPCGDYLPLFEWVLVQRTLRPLARRRFKIALPFGVLIRLRKPWVRANDFRDLLLLVRQRALLPAATTTKPRPLCLLAPKLDVKSSPSDNPKHSKIIWDQVKLNLSIATLIKHL